MKAILIAIIAILAAAALAAPPKWHQLTAKYSFDQYCADFDKSYDKATGEYMLRESFFAKKLHTILSHNADKSQSYKKGVNQFSDWTPQEWSSFNKLQSHRKMEGSKIEGSAFPISTYNGSGRTAFPKTVDYRTANPPVLTAVKNQGACGACWAFSAVESVESYFALLTNQLPVLSQQQVASCTVNAGGCGGGGFITGWEYISKSAGLYQEWTYPFTDFFAVNSTKAATAPCYNVRDKFLPNFAWAPTANVTAGFEIDQNNGNAFMEALVSEGPLSVSVGADLWGDYEHGIYHNNPNSTADFQIDHGVQAVGYGYDADLDQHYWIVRNSWGALWGEEGFIRLYRPANPADEPCGKDGKWTICGTSGIISAAGFPRVEQWKKK